MALSKDVKIIRYGTQDGHQPTSQPMGVSVSVYVGSIALTDSSGLIKNAAVPTSNDTCWGLINGELNGHPIVSSPVASGTTSGVDFAGIDTGTFYLANGTGSDAIAQANVGADCYVLDEITVGLTSHTGTLPKAGKVAAIGQAQYAGLIAVTMGNNQTTGSP